METVLKAPPDSTNSDLAYSSCEAHDESGSTGRSNNSVITSKAVPFRDPYLPEDDGSILTPEHAFVQYQTRSEDQACQICGQPAVGFHHRAYVCEACKKFFMRHTAARYRQAESGGLNPADAICPMGGQCRVEGPGRGKCPHCRYRKCLDLGMTLTPPGGESGCDISQIPCRVCGGPSSGFHFGALTCEGCKGFFRRTVLSNVRLECLSNNDCPITPANRNMCKSCRFQRCLAVGMSKSGSRIGRQPNAIKYYCAREISQLSGSSVTDFDSVQPSSSLSNGRSGSVNDNSRQRITSTASESDKALSSPWSASGLSIQPAHSSTDHLSANRPAVEQNGLVNQVPSSSSSKTSSNVGRSDSSFVPSRRFSGTGRPPDSPQSSNQKKRKPTDRYGTRQDASDSPMTTATPFARSVGEDDSDRLSYGSSPGSLARDSGNHRLQFVNPARIPRVLYGSFSQSIIECSTLDGSCPEYDLPLESASHGPLTLEYSLPDPDTSSHISSSMADLEQGSVPNVDVSTRGCSKLLAPLSVHMALIDESQSSYRLLDAPKDEMSHQRQDSYNTLSSPYLQLYKDPTALRHYHSASDAPSHSYRTNPVLPNDSPEPTSPVPSSNLTATKPLRSGDPNMLTSHSTRSIVDHLTSTVLLFRNQHSRLRSSTSAAGSVPDSPSSVGSRDYSSVSSKCSNPSVSEITSSQNSSIRQQLLPVSTQSPSLMHLTLETYSSPSSQPHTTVPITSLVPANHSSYSISSACKSSSPEVSWPSKSVPLHHRIPYVPKPENRSPNELHFRSPPLNRFDHSPVNGTPNSAVLASDHGLSHVVDVTSTSSASWFAAAAAAAAVANAIMVASQAAPIPHSTASGSGVSDIYGGHGPLKLVNSRTMFNSGNATSDGNVARHSYTSSDNYAKRLKMGSSSDNAYFTGRRSPIMSTPMTDSDLESIYALRLPKCDSTGASGTSILRSFQPPPLPPSSGSDLVTMRAAAAAAAAAAATAAGLVLSSSRVRPDELAHLHQRSPIFGNTYASSPSPSSPRHSFARSLTAVTSAVDLALYADSIDYLPSAVNRTPNVSSIEPTPSVNLQIPSNEIITVAGPPTRPKNGVRTAFITLQEFTEGISAATKYMISERKKIRNNLPQACPPMHSLERVEDVWDRMMQHFELHSRFIVHFVKLIPGFNQLELGDKRQLVRSAMYPLMLLELSRDYLNTAGSRYNYFDFTENEREVILKHFPTFHTITGHLIRSGEFLDQIRLDNVELTLVCAQEVFKNFHGLIDPTATEHLYHLAGRVLVDHIISSGKSLEDRSELLRHVSPLLEELNLEHHQVIAQLRQDQPQLDFPELYTEMFQLSEDEEREHSLSTI